MIDKIKKGCYNEYKLRERQKALKIKGFWIGKDRYEIRYRRSA